MHHVQNHVGRWRDGRGERRGEIDRGKSARDGEGAEMEEGGNGEDNNFPCHQSAHQ